MSLPAPGSLVENILGNLPGGLLLLSESRTEPFGGTRRSPVVQVHGSGPSPARWWADGAVVVRCPLVTASLHAPPHAGVLPVPLCTQPLSQMPVCITWPGGDLGASMLC